MRQPLPGCIPVLSHDIPYVGKIDSEFGFTAMSAVDTSVDIVRGWAYGSVVLLHGFLVKEALAFGDFFRFFFTISCELY